MREKGMEEAGVEAALMNIEKKLDNIQEMQQEMMDFLKAKEKAKLRGNINTLIDVVNNYKFNWNNEKYKTNKHILVQDIRRDAGQSIQLYREQIQTVMEKNSLIHSDREVNAKLKKTQDAFRDYQGHERFRYHFVEILYHKYNDNL